MAGQVALQSKDAYPLYPGRELIATGFRRPGNKIVVIYRAASNPHIALSTAVCAAAFLLWITIIVVWRRLGKRKFGSANAFWAPATTAFQGAPFGRLCLRVGGPLAVLGVVGFIWTLGHDVSLPLGSPAFSLLRLGAGDWLTVVGLGLSLVAWSVTEGAWPR